MTTTVEAFMKDKLPVEAIGLQDSITAAVQLMVGNDYSQLPVINAEKRPLGLVTSESILSVLNHFAADLNSIRIRHVMQRKPQTFNQSMDLLDLFEEMTGSVALIVDDNGRLAQIITDYDTATYFRQRAEDILLVENIEGMLKDFVQQAFSSRPNGEELLEQIAQEMLDSTRGLRSKLKGAIFHYTQKVGQIVEQTVLEEVIAHHAAINNPSASQFDNLTLGNYIVLFLYKEHWPKYEEIFGLSKTAVANLLENVRLTRNDLSHFREISAAQSRQLRYCYDMLVSHQEEISRMFAIEEKDEAVTSVPVRKADGQKDTVPPPIEDEPSSGESRYAPLAIWLESQPADQNVLRVSFEQIEEIIGGKLPPSAYKHRAWWGNDAKGHIQAAHWMDAGWRVGTAVLSNQTVRFVRIKERQKAYLEFFNRLVNQLSKEPAFSDSNILPDGNSWHFIQSVSVMGQAICSFNYAFGRGKKFRIELYIHSEEQDRNKAIFDALALQREEIEDEMGDELFWQRLDHRRASRISLLLPGHITDSEEELAQLSQSAISATKKFVRIMQPRVEALNL